MAAVFRTTGAVAALALLRACAPDGAFAQAYPSRQVRLIVPFGAGGPTDVIARVVAQKIVGGLGPAGHDREHSGRRRQHRRGHGRQGAAPTATRSSSSAPASWSIRACTRRSPMTRSRILRRSPWSPPRPTSFRSHPRLPAKTLKELIELVKANPGKYSFAQPSTGSTPHLAGELFKQEYQLDLVTVPFNSAALAINSTIGGHTPIAFTALPPAMSNIKEGKLRGLAVLSAQRSPALPEVPTNAEAGVPGARERYADRHRGARRHAEGDHRALAQRDREDGRAARGQAAAGDARLCAGREYARASSASASRPRSRAGARSSRDAHIKAD